MAISLDEQAFLHERWKHVFGRLSYSQIKLLCTKIGIKCVEDTELLIRDVFIKRQIPFGENDKEQVREVIVDRLGVHGLYTDPSLSYSSYKVQVRSNDERWKRWKFTFDGLSVIEMKKICDILLKGPQYDDPELLMRALFSGGHLSDKNDRVELSKIFERCRIGLGETAETTVSRSESLGKDGVAIPRCVVEGCNALRGIVFTPCGCIGYCITHALHNARYDGCPFCGHPSAIAIPFHFV